MVPARALAGRLARELAQFGAKLWTEALTLA